MSLLYKRIVITGGAGFLGRHVVTRLLAEGCQQKDLKIIRTLQYDLVKGDDVERMYSDHRPDIVIHLAAVVGGIGINKDKPGTFYYKNLMMGAQLLEQGHRQNIEKFVALGTICAYPKHTPVPFTEENLWNGYPEETNAPYGLAKKMMLVQSQAYRQEFGFNSIYLLPVNLYGPHDNFNPYSSHVIPAIIRKCVEARNTKAPSIICWGTGTVTREFLYVEDAANAIVLATANYDGNEPVNVGSGHEVTIKDLTSLIASLTNYTGQIIWDPTKPDGQPRRCLDTTKAKELFNFTATTQLEHGLQKTIAWYEQTKCT